MGMLWATLPIIVLDLFQVRCASCKDWENILHNSFLWPDRLTQEKHKKKLNGPMSHLRTNLSTCGAPGPPTPLREIGMAALSHPRLKTQSKLTKTPNSTIYWTSIGYQVYSAQFPKQTTNRWETLLIYLPKKASSFWCNPT